MNYPNYGMPMGYPAQPGYPQIVQSGVQPVVQPIVQPYVHPYHQGGYYGAVPYSGCVDNYSYDPYCYDYGYDYHHHHHGHHHHHHC